MPVSTTTYLLSWWVLLLSCAGCTSSPSNASLVFKKGNEQLAHGDYVHALSTYHGLEQQGVQRAELYCNTGNAFYKTGQVGWAVYYYEKGLAVAPLDSQLLANKQVALQQAKLTSVALNSSHPLKQIAILKVADATAELVMISLVTSSFLFLVSKLSSIKSNRKITIISCQYSLLAGGLLLLLSGVMLFPFKPQQAVIVQPKTIGRAGPSSAAKKILNARAGEKVEIQNRYQGWVKIRMQSGEDAWVTASSAVSLPR